MSTIPIWTPVTPDTSDSAVLVATFRKRTFLYASNFVMVSS
jgi:hypothetical protein